MCPKRPSHRGWARGAARGEAQVGKAGRTKTPLVASSEGQGRARVTAFLCDPFRFGAGKWLRLCFTLRRSKEPFLPPALPL